MIGKFLHYFKVLKSQPNPSRFVLGYTLRRLGLSSIFVIKRDGYNLNFYPTALSFDLFVNRNSRVDDEIILSRIYKREIHL